MSMIPQDPEDAIQEELQNAAGAWRQAWPAGEPNPRSLSQTGKKYVAALKAAGLAVPEGLEELLEVWSGP